MAGRPTDRLLTIDHRRRRRRRPPPAQAISLARTICSTRRQRWMPFRQDKRIGSSNCGSSSDNTPPPRVPLGCLYGLRTYPGPHSRLHRVNGQSVCQLLPVLKMGRNCWLPRPVRRFPRVFISHRLSTLLSYIHKMC